MEVAIKRVILQVMEDEASQKKLKTALREAAINSTLDHPNIVSTYSYNLQPLGGAQVGRGRGRAQVGNEGLLWL